jgi:hypothetical protein
MAPHELLQELEATVSKLKTRRRGMWRSPGKTFDKNLYQRQFMRKRRAAEKAALPSKPEIKPKVEAAPPKPIKSPPPAELVSQPVRPDPGDRRRLADPRWRKPDGGFDRRSYQRDLMRQRRAAARAAKAATVE